MTPDPLDRIRQLRERADWLRSPDRKTGPSPNEAEAEAKSCQEQAEDLACALFYSTWKATIPNNK